MKRFLEPLGIIAFWLSWPALVIYLRLAERSRVVVVAGGKVLLVHNWYGSGDWSLPGGGMHKHEDPALTATRELHEEVRVDLGIDQLRFLKKNVYRHKGFRYTCYYFVAELQQTITLKPRFPEVLDAQWVPLRELHNYRLAPDVAEALSARGALLQ